MIKFIKYNGDWPTIRVPRNTFKSGLHRYPARPDRWLCSIAHTFQCGIEAVAEDIANVDPDHLSPGLPPALSDPSSK